MTTNPSRRLRKSSPPSPNRELKGTIGVYGEKAGPASMNERSTNEQLTDKGPTDEWSADEDSIDEGLADEHVNDNASHMGLRARP